MKTNGANVSIYGININVPEGTRVPAKKFGSYPGRKLIGIDSIQAYNVNAKEGKILLVEMNPKFAVLGWTYADMLEEGHTPKYLVFKRLDGSSPRATISKIPGTRAEMQISLRVSLNIPALTINKPSDIDDLPELLRKSSLGLFVANTHLYITRIETTRYVDALQRSARFVWELVKFPGKDGREHSKMVLCSVEGMRVCDLPPKWRNMGAIRLLVGPAGFTEFCDISTGCAVTTTRVTCNGHI